LFANSGCGNKITTTIVKTPANNVNNVILKIRLIIFFIFAAINLKFDVSSCHDSQRAGIAEVGEFGIRQPVADAKFINKC